MAKRKRGVKSEDGEAASSKDFEEGQAGVSPLKEGGVDNSEEEEEDNTSDSGWKDFLVPHLATLETAGHKKLKLFCKKARLSAAGGSDILRDRLRSFANGSAPDWWLAEKAQAAEQEEDRLKRQRYFDEDDTCTMQTGMFVEWSERLPAGKMSAQKRTEVLDESGCIKWTSKRFGSTSPYAKPSLVRDRIEAVKKGVAKIEVTTWYHWKSDKSTRCYTIIVE